MHELDQLVHALSHLTHELREDRLQRKLDNNKAVLERIAQMERKIMATQKELTDDLKLVHDQQLKTAGEIADVQKAQNVAIEKIAELEAIIAAGGNGVTQELVDAVAAVKAQAQIVDDLIPDVAVPPVEPPTP